jgi:hypothetical protein
VRVIIPSRKRLVECKHALTLFPGALVVVREDEYPIYHKGLPADVEILAHPTEVSGIGPLKHWIMANVDDETLVFVDDDVRYMKVVAGFITQSRVIRDPKAVAQVLANAEHIAREIGAPVFGFDQTGGDVRKFRPQDPFGFSGWVGAVVGVIGRDVQYDTRLKIRADIDFCLSAQLHKRIIFIDRRFSFIHFQRFTHPGGNSHLRSSERSQADMDLLKQKWGKWVTFKEAKTTLRIVVNVKRRQQGLKQSSQAGLFV